MSPIDTAHAKGFLPKVVEETLGYLKALLFSCWKVDEVLLPSIHKVGEVPQGKGYGALMHPLVISHYREIGSCSEVSQCKANLQKEKTF